MSCSKTLQFCINHSVLLNLPCSKVYDEEFVNKFKEIQPQLQRFLDYFQKYNEKSVETIRNSDAKENTKHFVIKLSQYLNLSCDVCYELLKSYLLIDGKLDDNDLQSMLCRGYNTISLMQKIRKYYIEERMSLIRLMRYAFCDWKEEYLVLSNIILTISKNQSRSHLFLQLIKSYKSLIDEVGSDRKGFECGDTTEDEFLFRLFDEKIEILETMLIGAYSLKSNEDKEVWNTIVRTFIQTGFCAECNGLSKIFSSRSGFKVISDRIGLLQSLIIIQLASVDKIINGNIHYLINHGEVDKSINELKVVVSKFGSRPSHSILLLFMSLLQPELSQETSRMAELAIVKSNFFGFLTNALTSHPYMITSSEGSNLALVVHCILFDLVSLLCHKIHLNSLAPRIRQDLVKLMCVILKPIIIFSDSEPLNNGFTKMLEDLSLSFPGNLGMLNVIGCLMKRNGNTDDENQNSNSDIIGILTEFIDNLTWFCDGRCTQMDLVTLATNAESGDHSTNSAKLCRLNNVYYPYSGIRSESKLSMGKNQLGYLIDGNVMFGMRYSVWDVILAEVELTCAMFLSNSVYPNLAGPSSQVTDIYGQLDRLEIILDFMTTAYENAIRLDVVLEMFQNLWYLIEHDRFYIGKCESALIKMINLASQILSASKDLNLITRIVSVKSLFPQANASFDRILTNASIIENAWQSEPSQLNVGIIRAYLKFNVSVIQCERFLQTETGIIPPCLIFGGINFVIRSVLDNVTKRTFSNSSDITDLAVDCLILLNEIMSIKPKTYSILSEKRKARLELIQDATHEVINNSPNSLKTILSFSSMDVEILMKQSNVSSQMLPIFGSEDKLSKLVWMSLTLVKYIFDGPESPNEESIGKGASVILKLLDTNEGEQQCSTSFSRKRKTTMTYSQQYVLRMLEFLSYPYSIKVARMSLEVLKLIIRNTNLSIVACLGEKTPLIRDVLLRFFASNMEDQIVRANLFSFLSECVMCGRHGVLQLIGPAKSATVTDGTGNSCYDSCLDIINNCKLDDEVYVKLICSVSRFLSSLWIKECHSSIECLKKINIWTAILAPLKDFLKEGGFFLNHKLASTQSVDQLFEYMGNVYGLFGMEFYSSSCLARLDQDANFTKALSELLTTEFFFNFLTVFDRDYLTSRLSAGDSYMKLLLPPITWWKSLLVIVLSVGSSESNDLKPFSSPELINLTVNLCDSILNLVSAPVTIETTELNFILDHLSSCILEIVHTKTKLFSNDQQSVVLEKLTDVLKVMLPSPSTVFHVSHTDLLTASILLLHNTKPHMMHYAMQTVSEAYVIVLSTRSVLNKLEIKALTQAIDLCLTTSRTFDDQKSSEWVTHLSDIGFLQNCFSFLSNNIQRNDQSLLSQTLMQLFIRVCHTSIGSSRILQSILLPILQTEIIIDESNHNSIAFLAQLLQLTGILLIRGGSLAQNFAFRVILVYWDRIHSLVNQGCRLTNQSVNSAEDFCRIESLLMIGQFLFDIVYKLLEIRGTWSLHLPLSLLRELEQLTHLCTNAIAAVLSQPQNLFVTNSAHILQGKFRNLKQVSFITQSPKVKRENSLSVEDMEHPVSHYKLRLASSRVEATIYRLLHSSLLVFSRSTCVMTEDCIYQDIDYDGALLGENFSENKLEGSSSPISFGCLFSIINSTHFLLRDDIPPLVIDQEKIFFNNDLMRQIHEIALTTIVSHGICILSKFDPTSKANKNTFVSNLRSELSYYLTEFAKTRRRNTLSSSSPHNTGPRVTSTPYIKKSSGVTESFDGFCIGIDCFKKALDLM